MKKNLEKKMNTLRTNYGGEFTKNQLNAYLFKHGIQHQKNVPYIAWQNGITERKNINLVEIDICMLYSKELHKRFWDEAICCDKYILNRVPTKAVL